MNVIYVNVSVYLHIYTFSTPVLQIHTLIFPHRKLLIHDFYI